MEVDGRANVAVAGVAFRTSRYLALVIGVDERCVFVISPRGDLAFSDAIRILAESDIGAACKAINESDPSRARVETTVPGSSTWPLCSRKLAQSRCLLYTVLRVPTSFPAGLLIHRTSAATKSPSGS